MSLKNYLVYVVDHKDEVNTFDLLMYFGITIYIMS